MHLVSLSSADMFRHFRSITMSERDFRAAVERFERYLDSVRTLEIFFEFVLALN